MPDRLHRRYLRLWHVLTLGILAFALSMALWDTRTSWGGRQAALVGLVSLQMAVYIKTFVLPHPWRWLAGYFLGSLGLWLIEGLLDGHFLVLCGGMYLSQMLNGGLRSFPLAAWLLVPFCVAALFFAWNYRSTITISPMNPTE